MEGKDRAGQRVSLGLRETGAQTELVSCGGWGGQDKAGAWF